MLLNDLRRRIAAALDGVSDPIREADAIISHVYNIEKTEIYLRLFEEIPEKENLREIVSRRTAGEPLEYIIGKTTFFGYDFFVSPSCLIPRADTETVCAEALSHIGKRGRFIDIGTGSGCIAAVIAKERGATGVAVDISEEALSVARKNAKNLGVSRNIEFIRADIFKRSDFGEKFDLVVSNPPYIKTDVIPTLPKEVRFEPKTALDGGSDGLIFYKRIISILPSILKKGGSVVFEIGYDEAREVGEILSENGYFYSVIRDYGKNDRCVFARAKEQ